MSFRLAWYKVYYPAEFYAATFTNAAEDFDVETILAGSEAILDKLEEYSHLEKSERKKKEGQITVLELVYEMYARGYTFRRAELGLSEALKFRVVDEQLVLPYVAFPGVGAAAAESLADAYAEKPFATVEEARTRSRVSKSVIETLREHGVFEGMPETDQLTFAI
jgi:DNA polymerase-3 subunit alpha (Gram-positive type)